jgi:hypothetical protein
MSHPQSSQHQAPPAAVKPRRRWPLATITGAAGLVVGAAIGAAGTDASSTGTSATPADTVTVTAKAAPAGDAPAKPAAKPKPTIEEGTWVVGEDFPAGTYRVREAIDGDCYWEIARAGTNGADIIANDIPTGGKPRVTLKKGQEFTNQGCGIFEKV